MKNLTLLLGLLCLLLAPAAPSRAQFAAPGGPARVSFRLEVKGKMTAEQQAHIGHLVARTAQGDIRMPFGPGAQTFELNLPADTLFPLGADLYRGFAVAAVEINGRKLPRKQLKDLPDGLLTDRLADVATGRGGASVKVTLRTDPRSPARYLAYSPDANGAPYRIPALAATPNGHLLAFFDNRPCGGDIGYGEVDVQWRLSRDGGRTWSPAETLADGQGGESGWQVGFGDAAVAADAESDAQLYERAARFVEYVRQHFEGQTLFAVGHGMINRRIIAQIEGLPLERVKEVPLFTNCEYRRLTL